jgi:hypothetical protein
VLSSSGRAIGVRLVGCREEWDRVIRDKFISFNIWWMDVVILVYLFSLRDKDEGDENYYLIVF